ncbi:hypothetical protein BRADI_3g44863v3 [Brachypodium distachyon]|uniref:Uncharacterized protein n=1 Tax=Brachypodium distachyon TaxID=15368 RepID=A0A2K2D395_BRADI|nr:hypothetical protein BRADI_3g44863v3 [Brachypodium distachyon]
MIPILEDLPSTQCWLAAYLFSSILIQHMSSIHGISQRTIRDVVKKMREEVINLIPRVIYGDPRSKLETLKDVFDVSVGAIINKVTQLRFCRRE